MPRVKKNYTRIDSRLSSWLCYRRTMSIKVKPGIHILTLRSIKPFWPLLLTFVLPRALGYYQALKVSVRTRPLPRPIPPKANRSLNILFAAICIFLWLSCTPSSDSAISNVFSTTKTRLQAPTEVLFSRLASLRPAGLTDQDEALRTKLTTIA